MKHEEILNAIMSYRNDRDEESANTILNHYNACVNAVSAKFVLSGCIRGADCEDVAQILRMEIFNTILNRMKPELVNEFRQVDCIIKRNVNFRALLVYRDQFSNNKKLGKQCNNPINNCLSDSTRLPFSGGRVYDEENNNSFTENLSENNLMVYVANQLKDKNQYNIIDKSIDFEKLSKKAKIALSAIIDEIPTNYDKKISSKATFFDYMREIHGVDRKELNTMIKKELKPFIRECYGIKEKCKKGKLEAVNN